MATTLADSSVSVRIENGRLQINSANVAVNDIEADNGVIHVIDQVLTPAEQKRVLALLGSTCNKQCSSLEVDGRYGTVVGSKQSPIGKNQEPDRMLSDTELKMIIETELLNDDRLSSHPIEVLVTDRVVTLRGDVQSHRRRLAAHEIAAHYEGVRDVVNKLDVTPAAALPDREVLNHVRAALDANADVTKEAVRVGVVSGKVTLSGNVGSHWERVVAEDVARASRGVRDVENLLLVNLESKIADVELANAIKAAFSRARGLTEDSIRIAVENNSAILSGHVKHLWQKESAESVVRRFELVHVKNDIKVAD